MAGDKKASRRKDRRKGRRGINFNKLTLANDFVFKLVLENPEICKKLIELVLGRKVIRIVSLETEKPLSEGFFSHSVRFDVYVEGSDEVIDFEIQCSPCKGIEKRAREYQGNLDVEMLRKGKPYTALKESWIVFFCTFDPFGLGLPVYVVDQVFHGVPDKKYDDGTNKVFYNAPAWEKCLDPDMRAFLMLIDGEDADGEFAGEIKHEIRTSLKREDVRREFMRLQEIIDQRAEEKKPEWIAQERKRWQKQKKHWQKQVAIGEKRGISIGRTEGINIGSHERAVATARAFLQMGLSPQQVAEGTGLSVEEVRALL